MHRPPNPPPLDFAVIGAPKCGTTWFEALLGGHADVCFGAHKDAGPLALDVLPPEELADQSTYHGWFDGCPEAALVGESAVYYLYSDAARDALEALSPQPRIFVLVRDPVEQVISYHGQLRTVAAQPEPELERAWRASADRTRILDYRFIGDTARAIRRWQKSFGDRLQVILFDDLVRDPGGVLERACRHLDLDPCDAAGLPPADARTRNAHSRPRMFWMARWLRRPPGWLSGIAGRVLPASLRARVATGVDGWNSQSEERAPTDPELRAELRRAFAPCVTELEVITGRDLSHWRG